MTMSVPENISGSGGKEEESEDESEILEESPCGRWQKRREQVRLEVNGHNRKHHCTDLNVYLSIIEVFKGLCMMRLWASSLVSPHGEFIVSLQRLNALKNGKTTSKSML